MSYMFTAAKNPQWVRQQVSRIARQEGLDMKVQAEAGFAPAILHHLARTGASFDTIIEMFNSFIQDFTGSLSEPLTPVPSKQSIIN